MSCDVHPSVLLESFEPMLCFQLRPDGATSAGVLPILQPDMGSGCAEASDASAGSAAIRIRCFAAKPPVSKRQARPHYVPSNHPFASSGPA